MSEKKVKKLATKQINKLAPGLSVAKADTANTAISANTANSADTANSATQAETATNATNADSAQPAAFARVSAAGVLDAANSKNVASASREAEGVYCFAGISFTPRGGAATVDTIGPDGSVANLQTSGSGCPGGGGVFVQTFNAAGALNDAPFYVVFYR